METTLFDSTNRIIKLGKKLGTGGEGSVFEVPTLSSDLVAKVYHEPLNQIKERKLIAMSSAQPAVLGHFTTWPIGTLHLDRSGPVRGFLMPKMIGYKEIHKLYGPAHRKNEFPLADWTFLIQTARNTAAAIATLHDLGHVVGDINQGNIAVSASALVKLIDCDSFQVKQENQIYPCEVGVSHFTPPELQGKSFKDVLRTVNHDNFGLALICFHLLFMGRHPFAGRYNGDGDMHIERAIREFRFSYSLNATAKKMSPPPNTLPLQALPHNVGQMFEHAFTQHGVFNKRPTAAEWVKALDNLKTNLINCQRFTTHKYSRSLSTCPWCALESATGAIFFTPMVRTSPLSSFDLLQVWQKITEVSCPLYESIPTFLFMPDPTPLPDKLTKWIAFKRFLNTKDYQEEKERRQSTLSTAESEWQAICQEWNRDSGTRKFTDKLNNLRKFRDVYSDLLEQHKQGKQKLELQRRTSQLRNFLETYHIDAVKISGIGPTRKVALASYGIETAADIERNAILTIPGFGQTLAYELIKWRNELEKRFVFDPHKGVDASDLIRLQHQYDSKRLTIENALLSGPEELIKIKEEIISKRQHIRIKMEKYAQALAQAKADMIVL